MCYNHQIVGVEAKTEVDYYGQTKSDDESDEIVAALEVKLGADVLMSIRISKFEHELKLYWSCAVEKALISLINVDEGLEGDEEAFSRSVLEFQRLLAYKPNGVPKLLWVCLPLVHIAIVFMGPGNCLCTSTGEARQEGH